MVNAGHKVVFLPVESSVQTSAGARYPVVDNNGLYMLTESTDPKQTRILRGRDILDLETQD